MSAAAAQHIQGQADFPATPNGPQKIDFTSNNADTADSGVGTVDKIDAVPHAWLDNAPKEVAKGDGGKAALNDGTPPSQGDWERKNSP